MSGEGIKALVLAGLAALIFGAGWLVEGWRKDAEIERLKGTQKAAEAKASREAAKDLQAAVLRGDALSARLAHTENALFQIAQEKDLAIRRLTVGRRCLDGAAVRVLNHPAGLKPAAAPEAASEPVRPDAAFATDTDVGLWIGQCQRSYDTCRGRLEAIADFYKETE
jgi:hypothetical protein